jgi:futalosine hydrolase
VVRRGAEPPPRPDLPYQALLAGDVVIAAGGVGPIAAAVATSRLLAAFERAGQPVELVVSAGLAGGFAGRAAIGDVVVADTVAFADLGASTDDGFLDLTGLGLSGGAPLPSPHAGRVRSALAAAGLPVRTGTVLTLATMTGTDARGVQLANAHPDAVAEAMEGYGVAWAAVEHGLPWVEVRAVSNLIGRRDRSAWDIPAAFESLGAAVAVLR